MLATPVAGASDYLGMIITSQPPVLYQLDCHIYFSEIYINAQTQKRRASGRGECAKGRTVNTDALSMVALYSIPVCAPLDGAERFALVTKDPGATNNFITHTLA